MPSPSSRRQRPFAFQGRRIGRFVGTAKSVVIRDFSTDLGVDTLHRGVYVRQHSPNHPYTPLKLVGLDPGDTIFVGYDMSERFLKSS